MSVLSFGGCGDGNELGMYAEVLTDEEAIEAFGDLLWEAGIRRRVAYRPGKDTVVVVVASGADNPNAKALAPLNGQASLGVGMLQEGHYAEVYRNEELVAWRCR